MSFEQDPNEQAQISGSDLAVLVDDMKKYRAALEQIKLYHETLYGAKAKDYIAYDIACKALEEV